MRILIAEDDAVVRAILEAGLASWGHEVVTCADGTQVSCTSGTCTEGVPRVYVSVGVDRTFQMLFPYPGIPSTVRLNRTATLRVQ